MGSADVLGIGAPAVAQAADLLPDGPEFAVVGARDPPYGVEFGSVFPQEGPRDGIDAPGVAVSSGRSAGELPEASVAEALAHRDAEPVDRLALPGGEFVVEGAAQAPERGRDLGPAVGREGVAEVAPPLEAVLAQFAEARELLGGEDGPQALARPASAGAPLLGARLAEGIPIGGPFVAQRAEFVALGVGEVEPLGEPSDRVGGGGPAASLLSGADGGGGGEGEGGEAAGEVHRVGVAGETPRAAGGLTGAGSPAYTCRVSNARPALALASLSLIVACGGEPLAPAGEPNATVLRLEAEGWVSNDTIVRIEPLTGEEVVETAVNDLRPDTLPDGTVVYRLTEYLPVYAGCEGDDDPAICTQTRLNEYVAAAVELPRWVRVRDVEGMVVATFVIGADGRVRQTGIERSMGDEIDRAVLRAIGRMPTWHPGFHGGEAVAVRWRLPVRIGSAR